MDIIYAPEAEITMKSILKDKGMLSYANSDNIDDISFANKMEDENI